MAKIILGLFESILQITKNDTDCYLISISATKLFRIFILFQIKIFFYITTTSNRSNSIATNLKSGISLKLLTETP